MGLWDRALMRAPGRRMTLTSSSYCLHFVPIADSGNTGIRVWMEFMSLAALYFILFLFSGCTSKLLYVALYHLPLPSKFL